MPRLESLFVYPTNTKGLRGLVFEKSARDHLRRTARDIIANVHKYEAPPTCHRLPYLTVMADYDYNRNFAPEGPGEDGRLRYIDTNPPAQGDHYRGW